MEEDTERSGASASDVWDVRLLPAEAAGSPCRAAAAGPGAGRGFAGWPASCAQTGAEFAGTPAGSLLPTNTGRGQKCIEDIRLLQLTGAAAQWN